MACSRKASKGGTGGGEDSKGDHTTAGQLQYGGGPEQLIKLTAAGDLDVAEVFEVICSKACLNEPERVRECHRVAGRHANATV